MEVARTSIKIDSNAEKVTADLKRLNSEVGKVKTKHSVGFDAKSITSGFSDIIRQIHSLSSGDLGGLSGSGGGAIGRALFGAGSGAAIATGGLIAVGVGAVAAKLAVLKMEMEGFKKVATAGITFNIDKENNLSKLEVLTQDLPFAKDLMQKIQDYAKVTPYTTKNLMPSVAILSQYGAENKDLMGFTQLLGATSAGNAENLNSQSVAMGQMLSKGKLQAQERNQFVNAGVNPLQLVAKAEGISMGKAAKDMEDGLMTADRVVRAMVKATEAGGQFNGMMDKMSQTLTGKFSTLQDDFDIFAGKVTEPIFDFLKVGLQQVIDMFDNLTPEQLEEIKKSVKDGILPALEETKKTFMQILELDANNSMAENIQAIITDIASVIDALNTALITGKKIGDAFIIIYDVIKLVGNAGSIAFAGIADVVQRLVEGVLALGNGLKYLWHQATAMFTGKDSQEGKNAAESLSSAKYWLKEAGTGKTWGSGQADTDAQDIMDALSSIKNRTADLFSAGGSIAPYRPNGGSSSAGNISITGNYSGGLDEGSKAANKLADAFDNVAKSLESATDKMSSFNTVFDKLSFEKYSPEKIKNRLTKYFKEISDWRNNLDSLASRISPDQLSQLQNMGIQGFGLTKGLSQMSDADLAGVQGMLSGVKGISLNTALQNLQIEHTGTIQVQGVDNEGQLRAVISTMAADVIKDKRSQSLSPAIMDLFK